MGQSRASWGGAWSGLATAAGREAGDSVSGSGGGAGGGIGVASRHPLCARPAQTGGVGARLPKGPSEACVRGACALGWTFFAPRVPILGAVDVGPPSPVPACVGFLSTGAESLDIPVPHSTPSLPAAAMEKGIRPRFPADELKSPKFTTPAWEAHLRKPPVCRC